MARVVKNADERRKELLDTALRLFETNGYERTSIEQITEAVGVAKGTFYHYFDSKQDLLGALVTDFADGLLAMLDAEIEAMDADAVQRLRAFFTRSVEWKLEDREATVAFAYSLYAPENLPLRHALMIAWFGRIETTLARIIEQGKAEGSFQVPDARASAVVLVSLWYGWGERQAQAALELLAHPERIGELRASLQELERTIERMLGIDEGTLHLGFAEALEGFVEAR